MENQLGRAARNQRWQQRRSCTQGNFDIGMSLDAGSYLAWKSRIRRLADLIDLLDYHGPHSDTLRQQWAAILLEALTSPASAVLRRQLLQIIVDVFQDQPAQDLREALAKALTELLAEDLVEIVRGVLDALGVKKPRQRRQASKPSEGKEELYEQD